MTDASRPVHPGRVLLEDVLRPLEITQRVAAERLGFSYPRLNEIVNGKRRVTPETALRLARFSGVEPEYWLDLQQAVDLWDAVHAAVDADIESIDPVGGQVEVRHDRSSPSVRAEHAGRARRYGVVRVVPLGEESDEAPPTGTTAAARLAMVEELTRQSWELYRSATSGRRGIDEEPETRGGS